MKKGNEIKNWYNQLYNKNKPTDWRPYRAFTIFLNYLSVKKNKKLLDIGCGKGYILEEGIKKRLKCYGIDISKTAIMNIKKRKINANVYEMKVEKLKFKDNFFDYITCLGVLEHLTDISKGVKEIFRVVKPNAKICLMVPNKDFILLKLKLNKGTKQQEINEHLLSLDKWKELLKKNNFKINKIYIDDWHFKKIKIFEYLNMKWIIRNLILRITGYFLPLKYTYQFVFICSVKKN